MTDLTMSQFASKDDLLAAQAARIAELESQLEVIGAGGVEPLRKQAAAPQAVQDAVPDAGQSRFKGEKDWHWCSPEHVAMVLATPSEWQGYEARYLYAHPAPAHPAEGVPEQAAKLPPLPEPTAFLVCKGSEVTARAWNVDQMRAYAAAALAATQPAAQGMEALPMQASEGVEDVAVMEHPEWMLVHKETGAQKPLDSQWTVRAAQPAAQGAATTGYIAPKGRYVPPVLFSPYTGEPRDARDIASDPRGILIVPPGAALAAQAKQGGA